jgi:hypothetical protein
MTSAMLFGASSGALHAVTGPDHVLSLGPLVLDRRRSPWRIGMSWGIGHALGTLLLALPAVWFTQAVDLPWLAAVGDRLAGLALLLTAAWSFYQARAHALSAARATAHEAGDGVRSPATTPGIGRNAFLVGVVHGLTGAASLMLVVPMLASGSRVSSLAFLFAFALGSTLGMALLTSLLARLGSRLEPRVLGRSRALLCAASAALGCFWLLAG